MRKLLTICLLITISASLISCSNSNDDMYKTLYDIESDKFDERAYKMYEDFTVTYLAIGSEGDEKYRDVCKTGDYSFDLLVEVEISETISENRIYTFSEKDNLVSVKVTDSNSLSCDKSAFQTPTVMNKYLEDDYYYEFIAEIDPLLPDKTILVKKDYNGTLIEEYAFSTDIAVYYYTAKYGTRHLINEKYDISYKFVDGLLLAITINDLSENIPTLTPVKTEQGDYNNFVEFKDGSFVFWTDYFNGPDESQYYDVCDVIDLCNEIDSNCPDLNNDPAGLYFVNFTPVD